MLNHQAKTHFAVRVAEVLPPTSTTCPECGKVSIRTENNLNHWIGVHSTFKAWVQEKLLEKEGGSSSAESESDLEDVIIEVSDNSSEGENKEMEADETKAVSDEDNRPVVKEDGDSDDCSILGDELEVKSWKDGKIKKAEIGNSDECPMAEDGEDEGEGARAAGGEAGEGEEGRGGGGGHQGGGGGDGGGCLRGGKPGGTD